jgi:sugar diacid utilization regulator
MTSAIQRLVDSVAVELDSSTMLEDADERMIAMSSQSPLIDDVRRDSILRKETSQWMIDWFRRFGIHEARTPICIPADAERGILPRVCAPARYRDDLLGFLWFIDVDGRVGRDGLAVAASAADRAGRLMYEEALASRLTARVLANLLSPSQELREIAAAQILEEATLPARSAITAVVLRPVDVRTSDAVSRAVSGALYEVGVHRAGADTLCLPKSDHGVLLVATDHARAETQLAEVARDARAALLRRLGRNGCVRVIAAIGDPQARLVDAVSSYRQARLTARVAGMVPTFGDTPHWRDLGVFRTLALLPTDDAAQLALDPRLRRLFDGGDQQSIATLEMYLDMGCDAKATYERLHIHRATLYYRLQKVEKVTGVNLADGNDRLALHLGFKLSRLAGLHPDAVPPE